MTCMYPHPQVQGAGGDKSMYGVEAHEPTASTNTLHPDRSMYPPPQAHEHTASTNTLHPDRSMYGVEALVRRTDGDLRALMMQVFRNTLGTH